MFARFGKKDTNLVGIDIGSSSVKLVSLSGHSGRFSLDAYTITPLPPGVVIDGAIQDVTQVSETIERGVKAIKGFLGRVVVAVPSSAVISKRIEISNAFTETELEEQVKLEADQFIPYPLDEVSIDFEVAGSSPHNPDLNELLIVACRRGDVELREDAVNGAGLRCDVVDVDTYAMERAFTVLDGEDLSQGELVGIVDVGAATLTLNVFRNGQIIYNREQAFGSNELTNNIHQHYGVPLEDVELQLRQGTCEAEALQLFVLPFRATVVQQVSRALQFFYSSGVHRELKRLFLTGGTAAIEGLAEQVQQEIGVITCTANPFLSMNVNAKINPDRLLTDAPTLVKACGLAMRPDRG
ncbi:MAG: type IV pilus assembly protein PilM [Pontibacterium sp.]